MSESYRVDVSVVIVGRKWRCEGCWFLLLLLLGRLFGVVDNVVDRGCCGRVLELARLFEKFVACFRCSFKIKVVDAAVKMLSDLCWHLFQQHLLSDVVNCDIGRKLLDSFGQHCWQLAVSRDAIQQGIHFLFASTAISLAQVLKVICPFLCSCWAPEIRIYFWIVFCVEKLFQEGKLVFDDRNVGSSEGKLDAANPYLNVIWIKGWKVRSSECLDLLGLICQRRRDCCLRRQLRLPVSLVTVLLEREFDCSGCDAFNVRVRHRRRHCVGGKIEGPFLGRKR